jgi:type IV secretory pathway TrbD component
VHPALLWAFDLGLALLIVDLATTLWAQAPMGLVTVLVAQAAITWAAAQETQPLTAEERRELFGADDE